MTRIINRTPGKHAIGLLLVLFLILCMEGQIFSQSDPDHDPVVKVNTTLLNIPVIVSDQDGRSILGLKKEEFSVYRNGKKQEIGFFASEQTPMNVALVLDTSISARPVIGRITRAARDFLTLLGPEDKGMIVTFDDEVMMMQKLTSDQKKLTNALKEVNIGSYGGSNMNDAVYKVLTKEFRGVEGRKAIIVLTDGVVGGNITAEKLQNELIESDVFVYPIIYFTKRLFPDAVKSITYDQLFATRPGSYMKSLATATGGRLYAADGDDFAGAFQNVANELKTQYVVGIYLDDDRDCRDVKIKVDRNNVIVRKKEVVRPKGLPPTLSKN